MFSSSFRWISCFILLTSSFLPSSAQETGLFIWQFSNQQLSQSLPSCASFTIDVKAPNSTAKNLGVPPFYMLSLAMGGLPQTTLIGNDPTNLTWTISHSVGTRLLLTVLDANGNAGGFPPKTYTVVDGQSVSCIPPPPAQDFTVTSNVTGDLQTCQPWGLTVVGGVPPYNLTLAASGSPVITNVTLGLGDDAFTYINRADPGGTLIAAINDVTGRWAYGTPFVATKGSTNVDCVGIVGGSGNSTQIKQQAADAAAQEAADKKKHRNTIIGAVCAVLGVLLLICGGALAYTIRRRRKMGRVRELGPDVYPRQYTEQNNGLTIDTFLSQPPHSHSSKSQAIMMDGPYSTTALTSSHYVGAAVFDPYTDNPNDQSQSDTTQSSIDRSGLPATSRQSNKAAEAARSRLLSRAASDATTSTASRSTLSSAAHPPSSHHNNDGVATSSSRLVPPMAEAILESDGELIIQHRDGGGVVRELPPPYLDRGKPRADP